MKRSIIVKTELEIINLKLNEYYILDLVGMGTSGYSWVYSVDNENIIKISHRYIVPPDAKPGGTGTERFIIIGVMQGSCIIEFKQIRSWEKNLPPISIRRFLVNVK